MFSIFGCVFAQKSWEEITSVEDLFESYPETINTMFDQYNLDFKGLEKVKAAIESGLMVDACNNLLDYYENGTMAQELRREQPSVTGKTDALADTILKNIFIVQNVRGEVPWKEDGHRDWYYKGPNNDREWAWLSNRHTQINTVLTTYFKSAFW